MDFPSGPVVKNLPADTAAGDRFDPWSGETPQVMGQVSLCKPPLLSVWLKASVRHQEKPNEKLSNHNWRRDLHLLQLQKTKGKQRRPSTAKSK